MELLCSCCTALEFGSWVVVEVVRFVVFTSCTIDDSSDNTGIDVIFTSDSDDFMIELLGASDVVSLFAQYVM